MTSNDRNNLRSKYSRLTQYMLVLVTGAIVLFPAMVASFRPPYIADMALYLFWGFSVVAIILLGIAFYLSTFVGEKVPHRLAGLGNLLAAAALICLALYAGVNLYNDRTTLPQIVSVTADPKSTLPGQWVKLSAEAVDEDADQLHWQWFVSLPPNASKEDIKELIGTKKLVYWQVPRHAAVSDYTILVEVEDDQETPVGASINVSVGQSTTKKEEMEEMEAMEAYINDRVLSILARIARKEPDKVELIFRARDTLLQLASENLTNLDALRENPRVLDEALEAYFQIPAEELAKADFRPCCSKYPGIWPFCDPSC